MLRHSVTTQHAAWETQHATRHIALHVGWGGMLCYTLRCQVALHDVLPCCGCMWYVVFINNAVEWAGPLTDCRMGGPSNRLSNGRAL